MLQRTSSPNIGNQMNKRIKEIEEQCYEDRSCGYCELYFNREKFAELIIKECVNSIGARRLNLRESDGPYYINLGKVQAVQAIQSNFGVKL